MWINIFLLALRSIRRNLLRSFLTVLGVIIGVSAVVTMVTIGNGATLAIQQQISSLGTNLLQIRPGQRMGPGSGNQGAPPFQAADATAIATQVSGVLAVAPEARNSAIAVYEGRNWNTVVSGSTNDWLVTGNWKIERGRAFSDDEQRAGAAVCVVGATVRRELFPDNDPVGTWLRIKHISCKVVGILAGKGTSAFGQDQDDIVWVPLATMHRRIAGNTRVHTLLVSMREGTDSRRMQSTLTQLLRERRKLSEGEEDNFNILDTKQLAQTFSTTTQVMTMLLGAVAAVSLLVGGIGIMNIMLVSVTERTREIGLRLAIGAFESEVLWQFLVEAVVLAAIGGLVGILLALVASIGLAALMDLPFVFDPRINLLAFAFSAAIGIVFGYVPARNAAKLDPIEALRHE